MPNQRKRISPQLAPIRLRGRYFSIDASTGQDCLITVDREEDNPQSCRYPFVEGVMKDATGSPYRVVQPYVHDIYLRSTIRRKKVVYRVFFKKHKRLPPNQALAGVLGEVVILRVAARNMDSVVNLRPSDKAVVDRLATRLLPELRQLQETKKRELDEFEVLNHRAVVPYIAKPKIVVERVVKKVAVPGPARVEFDSMSERLKEEISKNSVLNAQIGQLMQLNTKKDNEIKSIHEAFEKLSTIAGQNEAEKSAEITIRRQEISQLKTQLLKTESARVVAETAQRKQREDEEQKIQSLMKRMEERMEEQVNQLAGRITQLESETRRMALSNDELKQRIAQESKARKEAEAERDRQKAISDRLSKEIEEKTKELAELKRSIEDRMNVDEVTVAKHLVLADIDDLYVDPPSQATMEPQTTTKAKEMTGPQFFTRRDTPASWDESEDDELPRTIRAGPSIDRQSPVSGSATGKDDQIGIIASDLISNFSPRRIQEQRTSKKIQGLKNHSTPVPQLKEVFSTTTSLPTNNDEVATEPGKEGGGLAPNDIEKIVKLVLAELDKGGIIRRKISGRPARGSRDPVKDEPISEVEKNYWKSTVRALWREVYKRDQDSEFFNYEPANEQDVEGVNCSGAAVPDGMSTLDFSEGFLDSEWNRQIMERFVVTFQKMQKDPRVDLPKVSDQFILAILQNRLKLSQGAWKVVQPRVNMTKGRFETLEEARVRAINTKRHLDSKKLNRSARQRKLKSRAEAVDMGQSMAENQGQSTEPWEHFKNVLDYLGVDGMSDEEEGVAEIVENQPITVFKINRCPWRNPAIEAQMRFIDKWSKGSGMKAKGGASPLPRVINKSDTGERIDSVLPAPTGMPADMYNGVWLENLVKEKGNQWVEFTLKADDVTDFAVRTFATFA
ncbi:hypothetical protein ONZ45_g14867 [Pleurotus djamor]|nr:hypothetical protein ONZ45_g14867 [Pleurotus djamor]